MHNDLHQHATLLRALSQQGGALNENAPNSTIRNRAFFNAKRQTKEVRHKLYKTIECEVLEAASKQRLAIVLVGPPGAGKSNTRTTIFKEHQGREFAVLDSDSIKEKLLQASLDAGTFKEDFYTPEIHQLEIEGHIFHPLEFASLVHDESSKYTHMIEKTALREGFNILIDSVGASETSAARRLNNLEKAGYTIHIIDVECSREVSERSIIKRWEQGRTKALNSSPGTHLGGRWVPSEILFKVFPTPDGISEPERIHQVLAQTNKAVQSYQLWRRTSPTEAPNLEKNLVRTRIGSKLIDKESAQTLASAYGIRPASDATAHRSATLGFE